MKDRKLPQLSVEGLEFIPPNQSTIRNLYKSLGEKLGVDLKGDLINGRNLYQIFKDANNPTGRNIFTIVRLPTPERTSFISYTLVVKVKGEIGLIKNRVSLEEAIRNRREEALPGRTMREVDSALERRYAKILPASRTNNEILASSIDLPHISEAEIRELIEDVKEGTFIGLPPNT